MIPVSARHRSEAVISVIIVDFRSSDLVEGCIRSLLGGTWVPDEIVVIDNEGRGTRPPSDVVDGVAIHTVTPERNLGYSESCNRGAHAAAGDVLLFLNADVTIAPDCLERCLEVLASEPDIGIVTCRLVRPDGSLDHACHRGLPTPLSSLAYKLGLHRLFPRSRRLGRYTMSWLDPEDEHDAERIGPHEVAGQADAMGDPE